MQNIRHHFAKRIFCLIISIVFCVSITACSKSEVKENQQQPSVVTSSNKSEYNFTTAALKYLTKIGTDFKNRNLSVTDNNSKTKKSNQHESTKNWIVSELKNAGYKNADIKEDTFEYSDSVNGKCGTNIVATLHGKDTSKQILACAHYDGDGLGDNGSGLALLLANACGLVNETPQYNVKFIFLDGEEDGELGSGHYSDNMTKSDIKNTLYMINIDSIAFGDYCNLYGGISTKFLFYKNVKDTSAYDYAMKKAEFLGFKTYQTKDLDGYYAKNKTGPTIEDNAFYTNPWTFDNPSPKNFNYASPSTGDWGDHAPFADKGIKYIYFEATNWYAKGDGKDDAYTGYFETSSKLGNHGMFMNTKYDTLQNLEKYFPSRAEKHFNLYSPLLSALLIDSTEV